MSKRKREERCKECDRVSVREWVRQKLFPEADPIKLFFFANKEFLQSVIFFYMWQNTQTKHRKSENEEKKVL